MKRIVYSGIAAATIFAGAMFTSANAMPVAPAQSALTEASELPLIKSQFYFGFGAPYWGYGPYYRGYRPYYRAYRPAYRRYYARPRYYSRGPYWAGRGYRYGW